MLDFLTILQKANRAGPSRRPQRGSKALGGEEVAGVLSTPRTVASPL